MTCLISEVDALIRRLTQSGLTVKPIGLEGRFHSPALNTSLAKLTEFCTSNGDLQLPSADKLRAPLRSNVDAQVISEGPLHHIALRSILTKIANWHLTLSSACYQSGLMGKYSPSAVSIGLVDSVPQSLALELGLKVIRVRSSNLLSDELGRPESIEPQESQSTTTANAGLQNGPYPDHAIAVVGMACRFPGADSIDEFWKLLISGTSMHSEVPSERFSTKDHRRSLGKTYFVLKRRSNRSNSGSRG